MRDPNRIDSLLEAIRDLWQRQPEMRLGQLLVNVMRPSQPCPEVFHVEDDQLARKLEEYRATLPNTVQQLRYYKCRSHEPEIGNHDEWGEAWLLFELDPANSVIRQIKAFEDGPWFGHDHNSRFDDFGVLLQRRLENIGEDYAAIHPAEFQKAWNDCNNR
ncbi:MAG TPA: hypothetical protein VGM98_22545 [Schlesneria sp.]